RGWPLAYTAKYIAEKRAKLEAAIPRLLKHPTPPFAFQRQLEATYTLKTWERLPEISVPTLVITGALDCLIPARNSELLAERIPGAKLQLIRDAVHAFMNQSPQEVMSICVPFL